MTTAKSGQIVRFHTPLEGEVATQQYVLLEVHNDAVPARARIKALNTGLSFPPVSVVALDALEIAEVSTEDLMGNVVFIIKPDNTKVIGKIISIEKDKISAEFMPAESGVETNVVVTIVDKDGVNHNGTLFVQ